MCADLLRKWLVLVVCACGVAAAGEPNVPVAEVNEPWIVAEHLAPIWESMTLGTQLFNHEIPATRPMVPRRTLSFGGRMNVIDPNGLVGLSQVAKDAKAFDEIGAKIQVENPGTMPAVGCECMLLGPSYRPLEYMMKPTTGPLRFTIDMSMNYNAPFPLVLSRLEWSMSALLSDHIKAIDIPFAPGDWTELVPGLEVLVEEATVELGKYSYRMEARYDPNRVSYLGIREKSPCSAGLTEVSYSWPVRAYPEMIVTGVDVLDAQYQSTGYSSLLGGTTLRDSGGHRIVTLHYSAVGSECGKAAFIRHVIAFEPYDQELQFVLENVPVPIE